ncbi:MAG: FtsW/RodA/SpoVE family cell cycle protein [Intestinibacillus sp.]
MNLTEALQPAMDALTGLLTKYPLVGQWYTAVTRFAFPLLALAILASAIRSLLRVRHEPEIWAYLALPNGERVPLTHWENIIGRAGSADVTLNYPSISRNHAALIRADDGSWSLHELGSSGGTLVNGKKVNGAAVVGDGDTVSLGGVPVVLLSVAPEERARQVEERRAKDRPVPPWGSLTLLTLFQVLTALQLIITKGGETPVVIPLTFLGFTLVCWLYCIGMRAFRRVGFEMETIAFFLCTLSLAVAGSSAPEEMPKQLLSILLGMAIFVLLGFFLRDLDRADRVRWVMAAAAIGLLAVTLVFGREIHGAKNWIFIGGFSFQPSELVKICYIFAGAATLDRLFNKRNLTLFIVLTAACGGCLALMNDFGTALILFVTFLVIAYLRSGDFATLALVCSGAGIGGLMLVRLKPHIASRFSAWGHAWEDASGKGFQQVRTMSAAASGGMVGVGPGKGWLSGIFAGDTDLVFGMLCEEWGLIIAVLAVLCIVTLAVFAVRASRAGRSSFYTIAACAATSLLVFQTCLNVFGAVDLLPLTGVTFPFVSNGGSSMLSAWGLLAFLKATDTRQNASFAIRLFSRRELRAAPEGGMPPASVRAEEDVDLTADVPTYRPPEAGDGEDDGFYDFSQNAAYFDDEEDER